MRQREDFPLDPEIVTTLEAIDATLAGEAVDPRHAELAELALLLAADRPVIEEGFARLLDQQVKERAKPVTAGARAGGARQTRRAPRRRGVRWWVWAPASAVAASLVAAVVIVMGEGGGGQSGVSFGTTAAPSSGVKAAASRGPAVHLSGAGGGGGSAGGSASATQQNVAVHSGTKASPAKAFSTPSQAAIPGAPPGMGPLLQPPSHGRRLVQAAQLILSTSARRVDQVSQEVYSVVGQENGIVKSSNVTSNGGHGGYAQFLLSVPSSNLSRTMAELSSLPYANVASRTDSTQDVTNQYRFDQQQLGDAQALRTSLLKQLANAITQAQIDSLTARIHDAEGLIKADEAALHSLQRSIGYSQINVSIDSGQVPVATHSGGFTLGKAAHDAGRVLTVAAGVALIVLAALLPLGLLLALVWWVWRTVRRRSRQQALDLA